MEGKLAASTKNMGGVKVVWSTRLRTAAGRAHWTRVKGRPLDTADEEQHNLKIELSTKIITDEGINSEYRSFGLIVRKVTRYVGT